MISTINIQSESHYYRGNIFSFSDKSDKAEIAFVDMESTRSDTDEDDGDSFIITVKGKDYTFFEERFENPEKYTTFIGLIDKNKPQ